MPNRLFYGDNLDILRRYIQDENRRPDLPGPLSLRGCLRDLQGVVHLRRPGGLRGIRQGIGGDT